MRFPSIQGEDPIYYSDSPQAHSKRIQARGKLASTTISKNLNCCQCFVNMVENPEKLTAL